MNARGGIVRGMVYGYIYRESARSGGIMFFVVDVVVGCGRRIGQFFIAEDNASGDGVCVCVCVCVRGGGGIKIE